MNEQRLPLLDAAGNQIAELVMRGEEDGWFFGVVLTQQFPPPLQQALEHYDDVIEHQTLSILDNALAAVDQFGLKVRYPNGATRKVFSLQINKNDEVCFRTTPIPPPAWLSRSESA